MIQLRLIFFFLLILVLSSLGLEPVWAIKNGMEAGELGRFVVAISKSKSIDGVYCSGTVIDHHIIATAAHCVIDSEGRINADLFSTSPGVELNSATKFFEISTVISVAGWKNVDSNVDQDDIAFALVRTDLGDAPYTRIANLEELQQIRMGDKFVWHLGYGLTNYLGKVPSTPKALTLMPHNGGIGGLAFNSFIRTAATSQQSTCPGDSGGPTLFKDGENISLLGVITGGNGCSNKTHREYIVTSFTIDYYKALFNEIHILETLAPPIPDIPKVRFVGTKVIFSWAAPHSSADSTLLSYAILDFLENEICETQFERSRRIYECETDSLPGENKYILLAKGMKRSAISETILISTPPGTSRAEVEAKAEADAKAKAEADAKAKAEADAKAKTETESSVGVVKEKTIICKKGKRTKKITGFKPKCPKGYKKR